MRVVISPWLCLPGHALPRLSELCRPLHRLAGAGHLLWIQPLSDLVLLLPQEGAGAPNRNRRVVLPFHCLLSTRF